MLDVLPPLIGFERPAIIRRATPDLLPVAGMVPGIMPVIPRRVAQFVGMSSAFSSDPSTVVGLGVGPNFNKRVHFGISWSAGVNRTLDTVTFGGNACARDTRAVAGTAGSNMEWWSIETALTSGDLVMDWSGSIAGGISAVFWAPRVGAITTIAGVFSDVSSGTSLSTTCNTYAGGYLLAGARWGTSPRTATWTGADEVFDIGNVDIFAMLPTTGAETARAITATLSGTADFRRLAVLAVQ